jgi:hypothetical protein
VAQNLLHGGLEPPDPVTAAALLATNFRPKGALGAFPVSADTVPAAPLLEPPTPVAVVAIWAAGFRPGGAPSVFPMPANAVTVAPPLEPPVTVTAVAIWAAGFGSRGLWVFSVHPPTQY